MSDLLVERRGHVLWLTLNRPEKRNAMSGPMLQGIAQAIAGAQADGTRAIVLTGAGDAAFCSGADLGKGSGSFQFDPSQPHLEYASVLRQVWHSTVPLVARVNGHCMAGGMGLLAMCDMAVAAEEATLGLPEVKVGLFPAQVLALLQPVIGPRHLAELCLTGEPISARRAEAIGLVNHVVPRAELDAKLEWLVARLVDKSPAAIRRGKAMMSASADMPFDARLSYLESQIALVALTEDAKEGRAAFVEKRKADWTGR